MDNIVITERGLFISGAKYDMTLDEVITRIGIQRCAPFGVIYYQLTNGAIATMLQSKECWNCCMCPLLNSERGVAYETFETDDETIQYCLDTIDNMQAYINSMELRMFAQITGRWLTSLVRYGMLQRYKGKLTIKAIVEKTNVGIIPIDDTRTDGIAYTNMASGDNVCYGVIETINNKEEQISINEYIGIADELQKLGCIVYEVEATEDVNAITVVSKCSIEEMRTKLKEVAQFKWYSDRVEFIGCKQKFDEYMDQIEI